MRLSRVAPPHALEFDQFGEVFASSMRALICCSSRCAYILSYSPTYDVTAEYGVEYARALANCTNGTDAATCDAAGFSLTPTNSPPARRRRHAAPRARISCTAEATASSTRRSCGRRPRGPAARGFVAVSINYRLAGDHGLYPPGYDAWAPPFNASGWWGNNWNHMYGAVRDAKAAVRWVRANAAAPASTSARFWRTPSLRRRACSAIGSGTSSRRTTRTSSRASTRRSRRRTASSRRAVAAVIDHWGAVYAPDAVARRRRVRARRQRLGADGRVPRAERYDDRARQLGVAVRHAASGRRRVRAPPLRQCLQPYCEQAPNHGRTAIDRPPSEWIRLHRTPLACHRGKSPKKLNGDIVVSHAPAAGPSTP